MGSQWSQFFPPKPAITVAGLDVLEGKVFIVTGGYSGIGYELAQVLYAKKATVYIVGRSSEKGLDAVNTIRSTQPAGGTIEFMYLDLTDLATVKDFVEAFKAKEKRLDVLWNNAGVSQPVIGSVSKQGIELQLAVNCLGPFLLSKLLLPLLEATSMSSVHGDGSARVVWSSSQMVELSAPRGGLVMEEILNPPRDRARTYTNSKTGNMFLAAEFARRHGSTGRIISVSMNPGACYTNLFRHTPWLPYLARPLLHSPKQGALTALFCGLSAEITLDKNGSYIVPWGRISDLVRADLVEAMRTESEGGTGMAQKFWEFCDQKTEAFV